MESTENAIKNDSLMIALIKTIESMLDTKGDINITQILGLMEKRISSGTDEQIFPSGVYLNVPLGVKSEDVGLNVVEEYFERLTTIPSDVEEMANNLRRQVTEQVSREKIDEKIKSFRSAKSDFLKVVSQYYFLAKKEYDNALEDLEEYERKFNLEKNSIKNNVELSEIKEMDNKISFGYHNYSQYVAYIDVCERGMMKMLETHFNLVESILSGNENHE